MTYTVITNSGKIQQFYVKTVAEMYQQLHGGVVFSQQILVDNLAEDCYTSSNS